MTITHDALDLIIQGPRPRSCSNLLNLDLTEHGSSLPPDGWHPTGMLYSLEHSCFL